MAKKTVHADDRMVAVEEALSKTEQFIEKYQKVLIIFVAAIVVIILAFYAYKKLYVAPMEKEALSQMFVAERYFEIDSLNRALYGDGNNLGFLDIIDEYGVSNAGNLARYYAGISFLKLGQYEDAIDYLKAFDKDDKIVSAMALGGIGDAYMELDEPETAVRYYMNAAGHNINNFSTPLFWLKAGWTYEMLGDYDEAVELYNKIYKEYPRSSEAREIEKYIARATALGEKK